jgi:hypothetical protein
MRIEKFVGALNNPRCLNLGKRGCIGRVRNEQLKPRQQFGAMTPEDLPVFKFRLLIRDLHPFVIISRLAKGAALFLQFCRQPIEIADRSRRGELGQAPDVAQLANARNGDRVTREKEGVGMRRARPAPPATRRVARLVIDFMIMGIVIMIKDRERRSKKGCLRYDNRCRNGSSGS